MSFVLEVSARNCIIIIIIIIITELVQKRLAEELSLCLLSKLQQWVGGSRLHYRVTTVD